MTFSKKIVAITVVAASGVMGLDVKNMDAPASVSEQQRLRELRSRSSGKRSRSRARTSRLSGNSNTIRGGSAGMSAAAVLTLSPAAKATADRIPKDKTAEEIAEVLKQQQSLCKNVAAPTEAPKHCPWAAPGPEEYCHSDEFKSCLYIFSFKVLKNMEFEEKDCEKISSDIGFDKLLPLLAEARAQPYFEEYLFVPGQNRQLLEPTTSEEMCLQQIKDIQTELCSAGSDVEGSYLNRFSTCEDAITVCSAAGVESVCAAGVEAEDSYLVYLWYAIAGLAILGVVFGGNRRIKCCGGRNGSCFGGNGANNNAAAQNLENPQPVVQNPQPFVENPQPVMVVVSDSAKMNIEMEKLRLANEELKLQKADLESQISTKESESQAMKANVEFPTAI